MQACVGVPVIGTSAASSAGMPLAVRERGDERVDPWVGRVGVEQGDAADGDLRGVG